MSYLKIGVIGCGYWGPNLIRNFVEITSSEVIIVADLKDDRLAHISAIYPQIITTKNYQDFFNQGLDAVVIATPPATHYPLAKEFLERELNRLGLQLSRYVFVTVACCRVRVPQFDKACNCSSWRSNRVQRGAHSCDNTCD